MFSATAGSRGGEGIAGISTFGCEYVGGVATAASSLTVSLDTLLGAPWKPVLGGIGALLVGAGANLDCEASAAAFFPSRCSRKSIAEAMLASPSILSLPWIYSCLDLLPLCGGWSVEAVERWDRFVLLVSLFDICGTNRMWG